jgi:glycolate oxidase FAD binding subunit
MAPRVFEPTDAAGVAAALQSAAAQNLVVTIRGGGTKSTHAPTSAANPASGLSLDFAAGAAPALGEALVSTTRLTAGVDHVAGDLVATAPAGVTLDAVNSVLRREGQWLPLDPPRAGRATIGGIVATNDSGPRRHRFGTPRDLIIGIEIALVSGRTAKAGGRVVKNVAGYDLSKLLCGSLGSLAVVTSATFKLSPLAPHSQTLVATVADVRQLGEVAMAIAALPVAPTAIELQSPPHRLLIRFETTEQAARRQTELARAICVERGATCAVVSGQAEADAWRAHEGRIFSTDGTILKLAVLPSDVADVLERIKTIASERQVEHEMIGRAALGIVLVRLAGDLGRQAAMVTELRLEATGRRGSAVLLSAPAGLLRDVGRWGPAGDAYPLMRAVKQQFDPNNTLNPGVGAWES